MAIGLFAPWLGLDLEAGLGPGRIALTGLGGLLVFWAISYPLGAQFIAGIRRTGAFVPRKRRGSGESSTAEAILAAQDASSSSTPAAGLLPGSWWARRWPDLAFAGALALGIWAAVWVFSAGRMTDWPAGSRYYHLLAQAFRGGQLHLLAEPDPRLSALANPYDVTERRNIPALWDASFYEGKYYLYWGPAPAFIAALTEVLFRFQVRDALLVLAFVLGTISFALLFLRAVWKRFEGLLPAWIFLGGWLALAVNVPTIWLLTRPAVYEASIAGGQFFLIAGLFFAFLGLAGQRPSGGYLFLAGIAWALAIATRINLAPAILFLSLLAVWRIIVLAGKDARRALTGGLAFFFPLVVGCAILAWYNWARFGSIFETGHRYQLTGPAMPQNYGLVISPGYLLPNLYSYLGRAPRLETGFPFLSVPWVKEGAWPGFMPLPRAYYYTEPVAGLLYLVPLVGLAALAAIGWLYVAFHGVPISAPMWETNRQSLLNWLLAWLSGAALIELLVLLVFISASLRYLADLAPTGIILATLFFGFAWSRLPARPRLRKLFQATWLVSAGLTVIFGLLIGLSGYDGAFREANPQLYRQILDWFQ